jgi:hypothetical protein
MLRPTVAEPTVSFFRRVTIALQALFRILANGRYAARILQLESEPQAAVPVLAAEAESAQPARDLTPALQLLSTLQREGRLVDFVQQDIVTFSDSDVGAAARVVHDGCRRALQHMVQLEPVRSDAEGHSITVPAGYDATSLQLTGNVRGSPPFRGTLRHRGWRASRFMLPELVGDVDCTVIAPAEVEL